MDTAVDTQGSNNGSRMKGLLWVNALRKEITGLALVENLDVEDVLRLAKKFERKCVTELKKIKGPVRASKLVKAFADLLRHLKLLASNEIVLSKIMASLGLISTHLIAAAAKSKECKSNPHSCAVKLYSFLKNILNSNTEWILSTLLCSEICCNPQATKSFSRPLLHLVLTDPVLMSYDISVVNKAMAVTQAALAMDGERKNNKIDISNFWLREPHFRKRSQSIDLQRIIKETRKSMKIKVFKSGRCREGEFFDSSNGVQWTLSAAPSELPPDFLTPDDDQGSAIIESLSPDHPSDVKSTESSDEYEPSSKRKKLPLVELE